MHELDLDDALISGFSCHHGCPSRAMGGCGDHVGHGWRVGEGRHCKRDAGFLAACAREPEGVQGHSHKLPNGVCVARRSWAKRSTLGHCWEAWQQVPGGPKGGCRAIALILYDMLCTPARKWPLCPWIRTV